MDISNISVSPLAKSPISSLASNAAPPSSADLSRPSVGNQISASVSLSAQGQKLSQSQFNPTQPSQAQTNPVQASNTANAATAQNSVPQSKETAAPPGIQFMSGESKGGRINTFA